MFHNTLGGYLPKTPTKRRLKTMKNINTNIHCPRCNSTDLYKYGKEQKTLQQKYQCKNCYAQFVPGREYKSHNQAHHGFCPRCGSKLHIRKTNKSTIQLRCPNKLCRYSISRPLNFKQFFKYALNNNSFFKLPKFLRYPTDMLILAAKLYFKFNLSSRQVKSELALSYKKSPSHVTIINWCSKFAYYFSILYNNNFKTLNLKISTWLIDETVIKINGTKFHLFVILDPNSKFVIAWYLSPTKDTQATLTTLKLALNFTKHKPNIIVSDNAQHFQKAIQELFADSVLYLKVSLYQKSIFSNNKLERFFSTLKQNFYKRRYPKSYFSAYASIFIYIFIFNFFAVNSNMKPTPSSILGISLNIKDKFLEAFSKCIA